MFELFQYLLRQLVLSLSAVLDENEVLWSRPLVINPDTPF